MMKSRVSVGFRSFTAAALLALGLVTISQGPASAEVVSVSGSAVGYQTEVGIFGGPEAYRGGPVIPSPAVVGQSGPHDGTGQFPCTAEAGSYPAVTDEPAGCTRAADFAGAVSPRVVLPSSGSATPITQTDADGAKGAYGPGVIFGGRQLGTPSGPITVSTQGTTGPTGSATSSVDIVLDNQTLFPGSEGGAPGGIGPTVDADEAHSTCTASETGLTGSTTFVNGEITDGQGGVLASVPDDPAPNTQARADITGLEDSFTVIFNEQLFNTDGDPATDDITVNAMHVILEGPIAVGHMIIGQVHCGVNDGTTPVTTTTQPAGGGSTTTIQPGGRGVTAVSGSAVGYQTEVALFNGPERYRGATVRPSPAMVGASGPHAGLGQYPCDAEISTTPVGCTPPSSGAPFNQPYSASESPSVTLPSTGSATPITQIDPDGARAVYGQAAIFGGIWPETSLLAPPSGPITVSTQGTTGPTGSATSSVDIVLSNNPAAPGGIGSSVEGEELHSTCTATETSLTGAARFVNGVVYTSTDSAGVPLTQEVIPNSPAPNTRVQGALTTVGDAFTVILNEQIVGTNEITVNAVHMILEGPTAVGHVIIGQVHCDVVPTATTTTTTPVGATTTTTPAAGATTTTTPAGATTTTTPGGGATTTTTPGGGATTTTPARGATTTTTPAAGATTTTRPGTQPVARVSDDTVTPGQEITVSGGGFAANTELTITFFSTPVVLGTARSDVAGQFSNKSVRIPSDATVGPHRIVVSGLGPSGDTQQAVAPVTVTGATAPAPAAAAGTPTAPSGGGATTPAVTPAAAAATRATGTLPRTGATIEPWVVMSLLTVVVGTVLVLSAAPWPASAAPRSRTRRHRRTGRQSGLR